jgi:hypothetical protein
VSLNWTVSGLTPERGFPVKSGFSSAWTGTTNTAIRTIVKISQGDCACALILRLFLVLVLKEIPPCTVFIKL